MASSGQDGVIKIFNAGNFKEEKKLTGHKGAVWSSVFSPDSKQLFSGGDDGIARIWDLQSGAIVHSFDKHDKMINWVAWSPDAKVVYVAGTDGLLCAGILSPTKNCLR